MKPNLIYYRFIVTFKENSRITRNFMLGVWTSGYEKAWHEIIWKATFFARNNEMASFTDIKFYDVSSKEREEYEIK